MFVAVTSLGIWLISFIIMSSSSVGVKEAAGPHSLLWLESSPPCAHTTFSLQGRGDPGWLLRMCEVALVLLALFCSLYIVSWKEIISPCATQVCPTDV